MSYKTIEAAPLTPTIGAVISGIDLAGPLSNTQVDDLHQAIADHQVVFFRDQKLEPDSLRRLGRHFGELQAHALKGMDGYPEVRRLHADASSEHVAGEEWHTDMSCIETPPMEASFISTPCRRWAATPSSPACTRPMTPCRTA